MSQDVLIRFMQRNNGKFYTAKELSELTGDSVTSVRNSLVRLRKWFRIYGIRRIYLNQNYIFYGYDTQRDLEEIRRELILKSI